MNINTMRIVCDNLNYKPMTFMSQEKLHYMDLTCIFSGDVLYWYNGEEIQLHSGDIIIFPQWSFRERMSTIDFVHYNSINVHFKEPFTPAISGYLPGAGTPEVRQTMEKIHTIWNSTAENRELQCLSLFAYLYYHLVDTVLLRQNPYVQSIKEYILKHLAEPMTLEGITAYVHLSREYCCSLFKKETGMPLFTYIAVQRMDLAKRLILLGYPLVEVAAQTGYGDYNYFARQFRKYNGMTPLAYKKSL